MNGRALRFTVVITASLLVAAAVRAIPFDHAEHATLFVRCETCHAGAAESGKPLWPTQADCAQCHDGKVEKWLIGGPAINRMEANGWTKDTVKPGDVLTGTGFQFSDGQKIIRLERVVFADGKEMRLYGR